MRAGSSSPVHLQTADRHDSLEFDCSGGPPRSCGFDRGREPPKIESIHPLMVVGGMVAGLLVKIWGLDWVLGHSGVMACLETIQEKAQEKEIGYVLTPGSTLVYSLS